MPTYVYECRECGHVFEVQQSMREDALKECPKGCGPRLRRLIQPPMVVMGAGNDRPSVPVTGFT